MVGQTEANLKQAGKTYRRYFAKNLSWPTYKRVGLKNAAYKIMADPNHQILGAHILSDHATGMINTIKQAMLHETTVDELYQQTIVTAPILPGKVI
jgi:glutathione reductase (NADPH)